MDAMGFFTLGVYWILHHYMFHFIRRSNGVLVWINILFFMLAALVPFSTKLNSAFSGSQNVVVFFTVTTVATILILLVMWQYATRGYRLVDRDIDKRSISFVTNIIIVGVTIMIISVIGGQFVPWISYLGYLSLGYVIVATAYGHHRPFFKGKS